MNNIYQAILFAVILALSPLSALRAQMLQVVVASGGSGGGSGPTRVLQWCEGLGHNGGTTTPKDISGAAIVIGHFTAGSGATWSNNHSDTMTTLTTYTGTGGDLTIFYIQTPTATSGYTFTASGTAIDAAICFEAWSGMATSGVFDSGTDAGRDTFAGTCQPTVSITPSAGKKVVYAALNGATTGTVSIDSSFTTPQKVDNSSGAWWSVAQSDLIQTPNGATVQPTWTAASSANCAVAAFKAL